MGSASPGWAARSTSTPPWMIDPASSSSPGPTEGSAPERRSITSGGRSKGRRTPKAIYEDNGSCFISKQFRGYCEEHGIHVIYGSPYHPQGRGKLERFHKSLTQELVGRVRFRSLSHFRQKPHGYRSHYNRTRHHGGIGWKTPTRLTTTEG